MPAVQGAKYSSYCVAVLRLNLQYRLHFVWIFSTVCHETSAESSLNYQYRLPELTIGCAS